MAASIGNYGTMVLAALALAACVHKPVQETEAMRIAAVRQTVLAGTGRTSKTNGYFVRLTEDGKGKAWMKGEKASRAISWAVLDGAQVNPNKPPQDLFLCLQFGPAINFPAGHRFCTPAKEWDNTANWETIPPLET